MRCWPLSGSDGKHKLEVIIIYLLVPYSRCSVGNLVLEVIGVYLLVPYSLIHKFLRKVDLNLVFNKQFISKYNIQPLGQKFFFKIQGGIMYIFNKIFWEVLNDNRNETIVLNVIVFYLISHYAKTITDKLVASG